LVALDAKGRSRLQLLQNALRDASTKLRYCVFDILFLDGKDMHRKPLLERKALLKEVLPRNNLLRYSKHIKVKGTALFKKAKQAGFEGVMAKRAAGLYYSGKRTREWLKVKAMNEQEVVIVGYTAPRRSRKYFGALVLAVRTGSTSGVRRTRTHESWHRPHDGGITQARPARRSGTAEWDDRGSAA
jgi:bifunctional non-homologous end joining protein LigD